MIIRILVEALTGIVLMTLFSYIVSYVSNKNFKEPALLNHLLRRGNRDAPVMGWAVHYIIGVLFTAAYEAIWLLWDVAPDIWFVLIAGTLSGITGVIGWTCMLKISSDPPQIALRDFLLQLVFAHVIFVFGAVLVRHFYVF